MQLLLFWASMDIGHFRMTLNTANIVSAWTGSVFVGGDGISANGWNEPRSMQKGLRIGTKRCWPSSSSGSATCVRGPTGLLDAPTDEELWVRRESSWQYELLLIALASTRRSGRATMRRCIRMQVLDTDQEQGQAFR